MEILQITCACFHSTARLWEPCITTETTPQKDAFPNAHPPTTALILLGSALQTVQTHILLKTVQECVL